MSEGRNKMGDLGCLWVVRGLLLCYGNPLTLRAYTSGPNRTSGSQIVSPRGKEDQAEGRFRKESTTEPVILEQAKDLAPQVMTGLSGRGAALAPSEGVEGLVLSWQLLG